MAKDTFEALLTDLWAELVAGLVIVTMGYFALNPNSIVGIVLSLCGCLASIGVLVYLFRDEISGKSAQSTPTQPPPTQPPPTQPPVSKSTFDDDDDEDNKKTDGLKAHYEKSLY